MFGMRMLAWREPWVCSRRLNKKYVSFAYSSIPDHLECSYHFNTIYFTSSTNLPQYHNMFIAQLLCYLPFQVENSCSGYTFLPLGFCRPFCHSAPLPFSYTQESAPPSLPSPHKEACNFFLLTHFSALQPPISLSLFLSFPDHLTNGLHNSYITVCCPKVWESCMWVMPLVP